MNLIKNCSLCGCVCTCFCNCFVAHNGKYFFFFYIYNAASGNCRPTEETHNKLPTIWRRIKKMNQVKSVQTDGHLSHFYSAIRCFSLFYVRRDHFELNAMRARARIYFYEVANFRKCMHEPCTHFNAIETMQKAFPIILLQFICGKELYGLSSI